MFDIERIELQVQILLGNGFLALGRLNEAREAFAAAGDTEGLKMVGQKYLEQGRLYEARKTFRAAVRLELEVASVQ